MIGYYVHHQGSGHLHRAMTVAPHLPGPVTGLSSLPRPPAWPGPWLQLARDDAAPSYGEADVTAGGRLHWVPLGDEGLRGRMSALAGWIDRESPSALVVDQSVEVCLLARLHGVPVVAMTAPGRRTDPPHLLGFGAASAVVGAWPDGWTDRLLPGLDPTSYDVDAVGAVARFASPSSPVPSHRRRAHAVLLAGTGGDGFTADAVARAQDQSPDWDWTILSRSLGSWHADPAAVLASADVVVLHPGQNSLAEVAALRVPAIVVPAPRPFDEQHVTAAALVAGWPAVMVESVPDIGWLDLLHEAMLLDGQRWADWCDGAAPERIAEVVTRVAGDEQAP
ncbi:glycosyltransferase [Nocardioides sp.]|uniref:glycosyltransferase n=1 Tax=Nocardioides sp. TaxID=35761 RepID=UPI00260389DE|nr:glycosyltransferase [Nocardioides sp.]MCW2735758.1 hypothetical protein [Nocardioides sp.]